MKDLQLTPHFKLSEFTRSGTASKYHIDNTLDPDNPQDAVFISNLKALCENVLFTSPSALQRTVNHRIRIQMSKTELPS